MENLKREISEETGLSLTGEPQLLAAQDILRVPGKHVVRLTYIGDAPVGGLRLDATENDRFQWFTIDELKTLENIDIYLKEVLAKASL